MTTLGSVSVAWMREHRCLELSETTCFYALPYWPGSCFISRRVSVEEIRRAAADLVLDPGRDSYWWGARIFSWADTRISLPRDTVLDLSCVFEGADPADAEDLVHRFSHWELRDSGGSCGDCGFDLASRREELAARRACASIRLVVTRPDGRHSDQVVEGDRALSLMRDAESLLASMSRATDRLGTACASSGFAAGVSDSGCDLSEAGS